MPALASTPFQGQRHHTPGSQMLTMSASVKPAPMLGYTVTHRKGVFRTWRD